MSRLDGGAGAPAQRATPSDQRRSDRPASERSEDGEEEIGFGAFDGVTVLLVEDDPVSREALELILAYYGARVMSAESAEDALECYERNAPTLVVSDIGLPNADGCMLLGAIRARERGLACHTPAIAVSGFPSRESRERVRQAGFDAFLRKPIDVRALLKTAYSLAVSR